MKNNITKKITSEKFIFIFLVFFIFSIYLYYNYDQTQNILSPLNQKFSEFFPSSAVENDFDFHHPGSPPGPINYSTANLSNYWKNDGTSTATGNWDIGSYDFTTTGKITSYDIDVENDLFVDYLSPYDMGQIEIDGGLEILNDLDVDGDVEVAGYGKFDKVYIAEAQNTLLLYPLQITGDLNSPRYSMMFRDRSEERRVG